jgi:hypothetical protein
VKIAQQKIFERSLCLQIGYDCAWVTIVASSGAAGSLVWLENNVNKEGK